MSMISTCVSFTSVSLSENTPFPGCVGMFCLSLSYVRMRPQVTWAWIFCAMTLPSELPRLVALPVSTGAAVPCFLCMHERAMCACVCIRVCVCARA